SRELLFHEKIAPNFMRGRMKALGIALSPAQERELDDLTSVLSRSRVDGLTAVNHANRLERLVWESEQSLLRDLGIKKILTPDQFEQFTKPGGSDAYWGMQAERREIRSADVEGLSKKVAGFWAASFGLDDVSRDVLVDAANRYVREYQQRVLEF